MVKHNSSTWWCLIGVIWFCFGVSHSFYCGKFEFKDNTGRCRPCRRCSENIDAAYREGTNVDSCEKSAKPTPKWLGNYVYYCQGINDPSPECKRWSAENGRVSCTSDMSIGTYCKLECEKDYYSSLNESIKCTGDLEWSKPPPYCIHINDPKTTTPIPECVELLPSNGYINCTAGRSIGSTCMLSCLKGYSPSTNHPFTCSKHLKWDRQLPICVLDPTTPVPSCQPLEVVNGTLYCTEDMFSGSECWVKCNEGFRLEANTTISCRGNQTWSNAAPSCVEIPKPVPKCKDLTVENGTVSCSKNFDVGSYCNITCSDGMMESSTETLYCRSNQTWSHSAPYCVSSVPGEVEKLLVSEKFPWYIVLIIVVSIVILIISLLTGCTAFIRRRLVKENVNLEDGTEAHELRPLSPRDSDCSCADQCGNCFICLGCNKDKVKPAELQDSDGLPADKDKGAFNELYPEFENAEKQNSSTERPDQPSASEIQKKKNPMYRRDISRNTATAEDLKNVYQDFQAMKKLETLFDQSPRDCEVTWHCLASHILKLTTDEIKCIEYKHKTDHDNTPTDVVFRLMKEREITLHEVIMYLQKHRELSNVKQALDILYGYCGAWEVVV